MPLLASLPCTVRYMPHCTWMMCFLFVGPSSLLFPATPCRSVPRWKIRPVSGGRSSFLESPLLFFFFFSPSSFSGAAVIRRASQPADATQSVFPSVGTSRARGRPDMTASTPVYELISWVFFLWTLDSDASRRSGKASPLQNPAIRLA